MRPNVDALLRTTLPDDLPPDVEARLNDQVERFLAERRRSIRDPIADVTDWLASALALVGDGLAARTLRVAASAALVLCGIALHAAGRPGAFAASVDRVKEPVAVWRAIDRATVMRCGGAAAADLGSPAELAERVYRRWVLVASTIDATGTTAVLTFGSPGDGAQYTLVADRRSMLPRRIVKTLPPGSKVTDRGGAYAAGCTWETPGSESGLTAAPLPRGTR
jgi:hypothetical protein